MEREREREMERERDREREGEREGERESEKKRERERERERDISGEEEPYPASGDGNTIDDRRLYSKMRSAACFVGDVFFYIYIYIQYHC